jgi:hypothetical protein
VSVVVRAVPGLPGVETSVPLVSFSINTPFLVAVRFVVDVTSSWYVGATPGVVTVVVLEEDDCAKPTPDINVRAVVAANKVLNIMYSPWNLWRAESLARRIPRYRRNGVNPRKIPMPSTSNIPAPGKQCRHSDQVEWCAVA